MVQVPRPPEVPGLPGPRRGDALRLVWWAERGFAHGARRGSVLGRVYSGFLAVAWWPSLPVLLVGQWVSLRRSGARYYFSPGRDAVLALVARPDGWHVAEHYARHPCTGRGRALRDALVPVLLGVAEAEGLTICGTAATRGPIRGRRLRRVPSPP